MKKNLSIALVGFLCFSSLCSYSQRSQEWCKKNEWGNRYEGVYDKNQSNSFINLVSLIGHHQHYEFYKSQQLKVHFYLPEPCKYFLKAEEIKTSSLYWMQSKDTLAHVGWKTFAPWPVDEVLRKASVQSYNLGVLVEMKSMDQNMSLSRHQLLDKYIPVIIIHSGYLPDKIKRYTAKFHTGFSFESGRYAVYVDHKKKAIYSRQIKGENAGAPFSIFLPVVDIPPKSWVRVEMSLKKTSNPYAPQIDYNFSFFHL